jgi:hypothetical protein
MISGSKLRNNHLCRSYLMRKSKNKRRRRAPQLKTQPKTLLLSDEALEDLALVQQATRASNESAAARSALMKMAELIRRCMDGEVIYAECQNGSRVQLDIPYMNPHV